MSSGSEGGVLLNPGSGGQTMRVRTINGLPDSPVDQEVVTVADGNGNILNLALDSTLVSILNTLQAGYNDTDPANTTSTPLAAGGSYIGTFTPIAGQGSVLVFFIADQPTATTPNGGAYVEWSDDGINPNTGLIGATTTINQQSSVIGATTYHYGIAILNPPLLLGKYYRLHIVNGATPQGVFVTFATLGRFPAVGSVGALTDPLNQLSVVQLVRGVLAGVKPDGSFGNIGITPTSALSVGIENSSATASGSLFTESMRDDVNVAFFDSTVYPGSGDARVVAGSGNQGTLTQDAVNGQAIFDTGTTANQLCYFASIFSVDYDAGHMIRGEMTIQASRLPATSTEYVEWGFGSPTGSGLGYRLDSGGMSVFRRKNGVIVDQVYQANWNGDPCLGGVYSEFVFNGAPQALNPVNDNLYRFEYEWLGAAPIDFFLKSPNKSWVNAHTIQYPNQHQGSSLPTATLPLYVAVHNDATTGGSLQVRCGSWRGGLMTSTALEASNTWITHQLPVSTTPVQLDAVPLSQRTSVTVINTDTLNTLYIGPNQFVSPDNAEPIFALGSSSMSLTERAQIWAVASGVGAVTAHTQSPAAASGTATNPTNVEADDGLYASFANGQTVTASSYAAPSVNPIVKVRIGVKAVKSATPATETVAFVDIATATAGNVATLNTPVVTGNIDHFYVCAVSYRNTNATVTSVTGLGLTWARLGTPSINTNQAGSELWYAVGTGAASSAVTVNLAANATNVVVSVSRYSGVDFTTPIGASNFGSGIGNSATIANTVTGPALGMTVVVTSAHQASPAISAPGAGYTTQNDTSSVIGGGGAGTAQEATITHSNATASPHAFSVTLTASAQWAAFWAVLSPRAAPDPILHVSYTVSGVAQPTTADLDISSTLGTQYVDVTADRGWVYGDIPNVAVTLTASTPAAPALVDYLPLEVSDTSAPVIRAAIKEQS